MLKKHYQQLVQDTLAYIQNTYPEANQPEPRQVVTHSHHPQPKQPFSLKKIPKSEPQPAPSSPRMKEDPMQDTILKHLPGITLLEKIPKSPKQEGVLILVYDDAEIPFLKAIAKAIQDRFCPVRMIDARQLSRQNSWDTFFAAKTFRLVLTERKEFPSQLNDFETFFLEKAARYQQDPSLKKHLWNELCALLKSS